MDISEHPYYVYGIAYGQISVLQVHGTWQPMITDLLKTQN